MRIEVAFGPTALAPGELAGRTVFVVDVLRATTTICAALHAGAKGVIPVASSDEALRLAQTLDRSDALLAGERNCQPIPGFPLGNSPREMTAERVAGRTIVMTTTNGTGALLAASGAGMVYVAAGVNLSVAAARAREVLAEQEDLVVLCAARQYAFSLDDAYTAGRLILGAIEGRRFRKGLNDGALVSVDMARRYGDRFDRPLSISAAGRQLRALGYGEDITYAATVDRHPVLPVFKDRQVTLPPTTAPAA